MVINLDDNWGDNALGVIDGIITSGNHLKNIHAISRLNNPGAPEIRAAIQDWLTFAFLNRHIDNTDLDCDDGPKHINWLASNRQRLNPE